MIFQQLFPRTSESPTPTSSCGWWTVNWLLIIPIAHVNEGCAVMEVIVCPNLISYWILNYGASKIFCIQNPISYVWVHWIFKHNLHGVCQGLGLGKTSTALLYVLMKNLLIAVFKRATDEKKIGSFVWYPNKISGTIEYSQNDWNSISLALLYRFSFVLIFSEPNNVRILWDRIK